MSRVTAFLRRLPAFVRRLANAVEPILTDIRVNVLDVVLLEIQQSGAKTDAARREIAKRVVQEYVAKKWPEYAWLTDRAVGLVWEAVRSQLRRRGAART